jgi:hypothetical protein
MLTIQRSEDGTIVMTEYVRQDDAAPDSPDVAANAAALLRPSWSRLSLRRVSHLYRPSLFPPCFPRAADVDRSGPIGGADVNNASNGVDLRW